MVATVLFVAGGLGFCVACTLDGYLGILGAAVFGAALPLGGFVAVEGTD